MQRKSFIVIIGFLSEYGVNIPQQNSFVNRLMAVNLHKKYGYIRIMTKKAGKRHTHKIYRKALAILGAKEEIYADSMCFYTDFTQ